MKDRIFDLEDRLISFAVRVIHMIDSLPGTFVGKHISQQVARSSTSPASNYGEAQSAESRADFVHKLKIRYSLFDILRFNLDCGWILTQKHEVHL